MVRLAEGLEFIDELVWPPRGFPVLREETPLNAPAGVSVQERGLLS